MHFTKMEGCGNDYLYVDAAKEEIVNGAALASILSDRHFGIGADGLILIYPSALADARMEMYNADGSRGKMCGNGIRCVGKYIYEHGWTHHTNITVETDVGMKELQLLVGDGVVEQVIVDMGPAIFTPAEIPVFADAAPPLLSLPLSVDGFCGEAAVLSMGNPHCVFFVEDAEKLDLPKIGPLFEHHEIFPEGVNTEFAQKIDEHTLRMRVWERGSGETMACGTGACAAAVAGILRGLVQSPVTLRLNGGTLLIDWDKKENRVRMTGPANEVFEGEVNIHA